MSEMEHEQETVVSVKLSAMADALREQGASLSETKNKIFDITLQLNRMDSKLAAMCDQSAAVAKAIEKRMDAADAVTAQNTQAIEGIKSKIMLVTGVIMAINAIVLFFGPQIAAILHSAVKNAP